MKNLLTTLFLLHGFIFCAAQPSGCDTASYESRRCIYSNLLGYEIDTMVNQDLYHRIADWLYTDYQYGGKSKKGIDCSDFASLLYEHSFKKKIGGSARDIIRLTNGISRDSLLEGDLVFFKIGKSDVSHVGVYLSQNRFAHATVHSGVIISSLDEPYYKKYFYRAGRLPASCDKPISEK